MARLLTLSCLILLMFLIIINEVRGRGRGGRGRYRGGGSRTSGYSSKRNYQGKYGYTSSTWKAAFISGTIYGGQRYLLSARYQRHPDKMPTICRNTLAIDENATVYDLFVCPRFNEPDDFDYCCGEINREKCCQYYKSPWTIIGIVSGVTIFFGIIACATYDCWKKKICACVKRKPVTQRDATPKWVPEERREPGAPPSYEEAVYMTPSSAYREPEQPVRSTRV